LQELPRIDRLPLQCHLTVFGPDFQLIFARFFVLKMKCDEAFSFYSVLCGGSYYDEESIFWFPYLHALMGKVII